MWILPKQLHTSAYAADTKALESDLDQLCQMSENALLWRSKPSTSPTWLRRWKRVKYIQHLFTRTLKPSHTESFVDAWTSYLEASHVSHLALPESVKQLKIQDTCFHTSQTESESANPSLFSLKTWKELYQPKQQMENLYSNMCCEDWKDWVTQQRQEYSQRVKLAHHTNAKESTSLAYPTPSVAGCVEGGIAKNVEMTPSGFKATRENGTSYGAKLRDAVIHEARWATPSTMDTLPARTPEKLAKAKKKGGCKNLREEVINWPTPTTAEGTKIGNQPNYGQVALSNHPSIVGHPDRQKLNKSGKSQESWPTPRANKVHPTITEKNRQELANRKKANLEEEIAGHCGKATGKLNPNWVEQLMGLPVGWTQLPTEWID
jgi:hypothetical protein